MAQSCAEGFLAGWQVEHRDKKKLRSLWQALVVARFGAFYYRVKTAFFESATDSSHHETPFLNFLLQG